MTELRDFLKGSKKLCIAAPSLKMAEALAELFVPLIVKRIIDTGIPAGDTAYILKMCGVLVLFAAAGLAMSLTAQYFSAKAAVGAAANIKSALYDKIMSLSCEDAEKTGISKLISSMTGDVTLVQNGINLTLRLFLRSPFIVFGSLVMAFFVDRGSSAVFAAAIPVLAAVVFSVMLSSAPLYKKVREKSDKVTESVRENLAGGRVVRAFGAEKTENAEFRKRTDSLFEAGMTAGRVSAILNPATYVLINAATVVLIYTGALKVDSGALTRGSLVALYNYMGQILVELIKLADLIITISKASSGYKRIKTVLSMPSDEKNESGAVPDSDSPAVEFINVGFRYPSASENCLDGISFTLKKGESLGITGGTGSGKSTLVMLLAGCYEPTEGEIRLFGNNIGSYDRKTKNSLVAVALQKAELFSGSVKENLLLSRPDASDGEISEALVRAGCSDFVDSAEKAEKKMLSTGGANLSGGQRQRLSVARALVKNCPVTVLDDSFSALDFSTARAVRAAVTEKNGSNTVIVSQRTADTEVCDKIIVLEDGRISGMGNHASLLENNAVYREIYECGRAAE